LDFIAILTAVQLIASIVALFLARAHQMAGNAGLVLALELVRTAGDILALWTDLIVATGAVTFPVTQPGFVDASDAITALMFGGQTG
jgi:hypothetical protein